MLTAARNCNVAVLKGTYGWRVGYGCLSASCLVIIPFAVRLLRDRPDLELPLLLRDEDEDESDGNGDGDGDGDGNVDGNGDINGNSTGKQGDNDLHKGGGRDENEVMHSNTQTSTGSSDNKSSSAMQLHGKLAAIMSSRVNWVITYAFVVCGCV